MHHPYVGCCDVVSPCVRAARLFVDLLTVHEITPFLGGTGRDMGTVSPGAVPPPAPASARQHQVISKSIWYCSKTHR